jgi:hypothetical protein
VAFLQAALNHRRVVLIDLTAESGNRDSHFCLGNSQ